MKKVLLVILDGWGESGEMTGNAIKGAKTPNLNTFVSFYPRTTLQASGASVGLPWGTMGNSEVGHLTIGAGKVLYQNLPRVTLSIQDGTFFQNPALLQAIEHAKKSGSDIHLMGLVSDGAVHSHINHLYALLELLKNQEVAPDKAFIHAFTDGRDVDPHSGTKYLAELETTIKNEGYPGRIASVMGRYFAMDRNNNWDRTKKAYDCLVHGAGQRKLSAREVFKASYEGGITDEFIEPTLVSDEKGEVHAIKPQDTVIFFNIREDRARQLTKAFILEEFTDFDRGAKLADLSFTTMVEYEKDLPAQVVFPPETVEDPLGKVLSEAGLRQLRIAETEKYAHVTYFFNGGVEKPFSGEDRLLIPSPDVDYYDKTPEMSAGKITDNIITSLQSGKYDFILANFANGDMIGHTGNMPAAVSAIEYLDGCLGRLHEATADSGVIMLITADHGNVEQMVNLRTGDIDTEHSVNPVPFILVDEDRKTTLKNPDKITVGGMLSDIAPTVLDIMNVEKPASMSGVSLLSSL